MGSPPRALSQVRGPLKTGASALLALGIAAMAANARAQGGPPMLTDDPGTPGDGNWEINLSAATRYSSSESETELPLVDINYGLGERIQLKYELPYLWMNDDERGSHSRLGQSQVGIKVRFYDAGPTGWQISTYPQAEFRNPGSDTDEGTSVFLPFEFQRAFELFSINFEVGRELNADEDDQWAAGFALGREWSERLEFMGEIHAYATVSLDRSAISVNLGARIAFPGGRLLLSAGCDLHNAIEERASVLGYIGWQVAR